MWHFSGGLISIYFTSTKERTYNLPRPLEPSAIVRFKPSFLICIATCWISGQLTSKIPREDLETFLRFAAVFVSFWQKPHTDPHLAILKTPVVFQGGCTWPLLHVVFPSVLSILSLRTLYSKNIGPSEQVINLTAWPCGEAQLEAGKGKKAFWVVKFRLRGGTKCLQRLHATTGR